MKDNQDISSRKLIDRLVPDPHWGAMQGMLATTFDLRPEFLETDFLPSVFGLGAWDDQSWATRIALEKRLFELDAAVILAEARRYRGRPRSLRLDVRPAVSPRGSVLHAKVTLLLFERAVRLIVGSANLTKQGYRENREVIAVLTATQKSKKEAALITQGLMGMESALSSWLTPEARKLIRRSIETVQPWLNGNADPDTAFIWSNGQTRLWHEFVGRWPVGEPVKRISIISPFWSQDASLTLATFLTRAQKCRAARPRRRSPPADRCLQKSQRRTHPGFACGLRHARLAGAWRQGDRPAGEPRGSPGGIGWHGRFHCHARTSCQGGFGRGHPQWFGLSRFG